jgi:hydrogenase nickel incorporation protein HypA/HybF
MHERSLVRALLRQVEGLAEAHSSSRVLSIRVRIGEFSGVVPELLASAYEELKTDTTLRDATLDLEQTPLEAACKQCGNEFRIERFKFECDSCGSAELTIRGGEEMLLDSVTMEETRL